MKRSIFIAIPIFSLMFIIGCLGDDPETDQPAQVVTSIQASLKEEPKPAPKAESKVDRKSEIEKWNSYVDLGNDLETDYFQVINSYFDAFGNGPDYKPTDQTAKIDAFTNSLTSPEQLSKTVEQALLMSAREPQNELDQAVGELAGHFKTLWQALIRSREYHAAGTHPPATGEGQEVGSGFGPDSAQILHTQIYESYQGLNATYSRFRDTLNKADAERRKKDIQEMGGQGLVIRPAMLKLIDHVQALQDLLSSRSITSETLPNLNIDDFTPLFNEFMKSAEEFEKTLGDRRQPAREKLKETALVSFNQQLMVVRASATSLLARHQLKTKAEPFPEETPGTPEHFGRAAGDLVDRYNAAIE